MTKRHENFLVGTIFLVVYFALLVLAESLDVGVASTSEFVSWFMPYFMLLLFYHSCKEKEGAETAKPSMTLKSSPYWAVFSVAMVIVPFGELFGRLTGSW